MTRKLGGAQDWVWRRFGRDHDKPCADPSMLTCAMPDCQIANECRKLRAQKEPASLPKTNIYDNKARRQLEAICELEDKIADIQSRVRTSAMGDAAAALALTFATAELRRLKNGGRPFGAESK